MASPGFAKAVASTVALSSLMLASPAALAETGTVIEAFGSTRLVQSGSNFYFNPVGGGTGPQLKYNGAALTAGQLGAWTPIGAEKTASGYNVAWKNTSSGEYMVVSTDSSGNFASIIVPPGAGSSAALKSAETAFQQDLNGDGMIGVSASPTGRVIESFGSTSLAQSGSNFYFNPTGGGTGPQLKYNGSAVTAGQFGAWTPIGAERTASGYDVAWKNSSSGDYMVMSADSSGNFKSIIVPVGPGSSAALQSIETIFRQDLNGDGILGASPAPVSGVCGSASGTQASSKPSTNLCSTGVASSVAGSGPWTWSCSGSNSGTTASCSALASSTPPTPTPTPGPVAGGGGNTPPPTTPPSTTPPSTTPPPTVTISANPTSMTSGKISTVTWSSTNATSCTASGGWSGTKPTSGTLAASLTSTTTYTLTCTGSGGTSAAASTTVAVSAAPAAVSGVCGSANGTTASAKPSTNLCSAGTASSVAGSGPWTWSCSGSNSGTTASCSASASVAGGPTPPSTPSPSPSTNLQAGWLYTSGNKIMVADGNGSGTQWMGRGTNMDDVFLCGFNANFASIPTKSDAAAISVGESILSWNANFIRISLSMNSFGGQTYTWNKAGQTPTTYQTLMTNVINTLATGNVYVLVTLRSHSTMVESFAGNEATYMPTAATDAIYQGIVDSFATNKNVLFAVTNEPTGDSATIATTLAHAVNTIRTEEAKLGVPNHIVSVQGTNWTSDISYYSSHPINSPNIVYEVHGYPPSPSSYTFANIPVIIGEYGLLSDSNAFFKDIEGKMISSLAWDFDPYSNCAPDLVNITRNSGNLNAPITPSAWGNVVKAYLENPGSFNAGVRAVDN